MGREKVYDDEMFIQTVKKFGPDTASGFAKGLKLHQSLLRRRLNELADKGDIVKVSSFPVTYGPKTNEKLPQPEPNLEEKKDFFGQVMELPQMEMEILNLLKRGNCEGLPITKIFKILGYGKSTVGRALRHLEKHGYLVSHQRGRGVYWMVKPYHKVPTELEETRAMLSVGSLLSIIQNAFKDLQLQIQILTAQNEAFRNVSKNTHFENRTLVDEETIREDERRRVFAAVGKIMGMGPGIIADWYNAGK